MQIELVLTFLLLFVLSLLATVDMAFSQLSDVGLRRLISEAEERPTDRSTKFLRQVLGEPATVQFHALGCNSNSVSGRCRPDHLNLPKLFSEPRFVLIGLVAGLMLAGIFRQFIPLLVSVRNPEATLLFLLPLIRPFFRVMAFAANPFHKWFDRSRKKELVPENGEEDDGRGQL